jgi:hypothetical protein
MSPPGKIDVVVWQKSLGKSEVIEAYRKMKMKNDLKRIKVKTRALEILEVILELRKQIL